MPPASPDHERTFMRRPAATAKQDRKCLVTRVHDLSNASGVRAMVPGWRSSAMPGSRLGISIRRRSWQRGSVRQRPAAVVPEISGPAGLVDASCIVRQAGRLGRWYGCAACEAPHLSRWQMARRRTALNRWLYGPFGNHALRLARQLSVVGEERRPGSVLADTGPRPPPSWFGQYAEAGGVRGAEISAAW